MDFEFKTRGNSSPEGKSRVCIVGHPSDFLVYFENLYNQILEYQNCAIWYTEDDFRTIDEDAEFYLSQMQLFVVMVTERFLMKDRYTAQMILDYSNKFHIPLLPILYTAGIDDLYAECYGTLHYISPVTNDTYVTDISFEKKLENHLQKILVGDDEISAIRNAFDASIFMSYRKKDREYALMLMKRIHQNPRFQSVAIWYDEFLVPGDSFLSGIDEKLQSCDLFTMVVTPHLLEPGNFVMNKEYKDAVLADKKIFPVEMVNTKRELLQQFYVNIPPCASYEYDDMFDAMLYENLSSTLPSTMETDVAQSYFLGLAYLNGIHVEIDTNRALHLLQSSANGGFIPAYKQLITMYREGHGVERHIKTSLYWQNIFITVLSQNYDRNPSTFLKNELYAALFDIIEFYEKEHQIDEAEPYIQRMRTLTDTALSYENAIIYAKVLMKQAALEKEKGNLAVARSHYAESINIRKKLVNASPDDAIQSEHWRALSAAYLALGDLEMNEAHDYPAAQEWYAEAGEIRQYLASSCKKGSPEEIYYRRDLALVYWRMGNLMASASLEENADPKTISASYRFYQMCLDERLQIEAETKSEQAKDEVATAYLGLAKLDLHYKDAAIAEENINPAIHIMKELVQNRGTYNDRNKLARAHEIKGNILTKKSDFTAALVEFELSQNIIAAIIEERRTAYYVEYLAQLYESAGYLGLQWDNSSIALYYYQKAYPLYKEIVNAQKPAHKQRYIEKHSTLANTLMALSNLEAGSERLQYLREASYIWYSLAMLYPDIPVFQSNYEKLQKLIDQI